MPVDLTTIQDSLSGLTDAELKAVAKATKDCRPFAPGLVAWVERACIWETNRRVGRYHYELLSIEAAVDAAETGASVDAASAMRAKFERDPPAVVAFFDALVDVLTGERREH